MSDSLNVIFIVVDTLRKDYAKPLENELKRLGFISYDNVIAPASWTTPSHASIFTGLYPAFHGAHESRTKKHLKVKIKNKFKNILISEELLKNDYETFLLTANMFVSPYFGFSGFSHIYDTIGISLCLSNTELSVLNTIKMKHQAKTEYDYVKVLMHNGYYKLLLKIALKYLLYKTYKFLNWPKDKGARNTIKIFKEIIKTSLSQPKFVFINLMEVHEPYFKWEGNVDKNFIMNIKTNKLNHALVQKWKKKYPEEVRYVTKKILELMKILKERKVFDNSLIVVTSDHGQLLGEHGRISHGTFLYDELLRVPLLIKYPEGYEIEHFQDSSRYRYISLVKLKPLILSVLDNKLNDDDMLYSNTVFAESYGVHQNVGELSSEEEKKNIEQLEKYRIAVYYKSFKGIFNVTDWKFEEIISYDPKIEVTEDIVKHMKKEVVKFLKTATLTKVPKIKA